MRRRIAADDLCSLLASVGTAVLLGAAAWLSFGIAQTEEGKCPRPCANLAHDAPCTLSEGPCARAGEAFLTRLPVVVVVALLIVLFVPGWVRAMRMPHPRMAGTIICGIGVLAIVAAGFGPAALVCLAALAIFAVFVGEMLRSDGRENLLGQVAGTYLGLLAAISAAFWIVLAIDLDGELLVSPVSLCIVVCILSGSLGRYATSVRVERRRRSGWLLLWLTFYAYLGAVVLLVVLGAFQFGAFAWAFCIALVYGIVAGLADIAAKTQVGRAVAVSLAVVPYCALGVTAFALTQFLE